MKKQSTVNVAGIVNRSKFKIHRHLKKVGWYDVSAEQDSFARASCRQLIARYTAGVAGEFQAWLGIAYAYARHEDAQRALKNNLRCELGQDHIGMLYKFARQVGAYPTPDHRRYVEEHIKRLRLLFADTLNVGLAGLTVLTVLETASQVFIPVLADVAKSLGAKDLTYTNVHGEADAPHSNAFLHALVLE